MNTEYELASEPRRSWSARAIVASLPLLSVGVCILAPAPKWEASLWLSVICLAYLPMATAWDCWGSEKRTRKALLRSFGSVGAMFVGGILGLALHVVFHRALYLETFPIWAFAGATGSLSASLFFPWFGDVSMSVADFFLGGV